MGAKLDRFVYTAIFLEKWYKVGFLAACLAELSKSRNTAKRGLLAYIALLFQRVA